MELTATSQCSTLHEIVDWEVKKSEPKLSLAFPVISQIIHVFNLYCKCFFCTYLFQVRTVPLICTENTN